MTRRFYCPICRAIETEESAIRVRLADLSLSVAGCPRCKEPLRLVKEGTR